MMDIDSMYVDYDSPIKLLIDEMSENIASQTDEYVMKAICKLDVDIEKDKLIRILHQDKERYTDAYKKGYKEGYIKLEEELTRMQAELYKMLVDKSEEEISDGSSGAFCDGVKSGFYDAACLVHEYFRKELMKED